MQGKLPSRELLGFDVRTCMLLKVLETSLSAFGRYYSGLNPEFAQRCFVYMSAAECGALTDYTETSDEQEIAAWSVADLTDGEEVLGCEPCTLPITSCPVGEYLIESECPEKQCGITATSGRRQKSSSGTKPSSDNKPSSRTMAPSSVNFNGVGSSSGGTSNDSPQSSRTKCYRCNICQDNEYNLNYASRVGDKCNKCSDGMNCLEPGRHGWFLYALEGYWQVAIHSFISKIVSSKSIIPEYTDNCR